ncbi:MAG: methyltransferase domain-containing protein [Anaerolineae bacterium]
MPRAKKPRPGGKGKGTRRPPRQQPETNRYEAVVVAGLETIARRELAVHLERRVTLHRIPADAEPGVFRFDSTGGLRALLRMKTIQAIYHVRWYDVPRPKALLGDAHFRQLVADIAMIRAIHPPEAFQTLHISAAGEDTAVMQRLREALAAATGLQPDMEEGDLLLRLRRPRQGVGWEVLTRISPRPLATRPWRVCNMEGALNATVAHAMALMTDPQPHDVFLNLACGSGSILIERLAAAPARQAIGCDTSPEALDCARANVAAARFGDQRVALQPWDMCDLPLETASVDALCADLPFGHLVGSHAENLELYPATLKEAARVARPGALFALITHEVRLTESLLAESGQWATVAVQRIALGGLNPRIFVLQRLP